MVTTCLIGSSPSVAVRTFWAEDQSLSAAFVAQLRNWANLDELRLEPKESVIKVARHYHGGKTYTWIALYRAAGGYKTERKTTNMGVGFCLTGLEAVHGRVALDYLVETLQAFLDIYAPDGALTKKMVALSPEEFREPASGDALRRDVFERTEGIGLAARSKEVVGGTLFFDLVGPDERDKIADYIDACQADPKFEDYHTLLIGDAPKASESRLNTGVEVVSATNFLADKIPPKPVAAPGQPARDALPDHDRLTASSRGAELQHLTRMYVDRSPPRVRREAEPGYYRGILHGAVGAVVVMTIFLLLVGHPFSGRSTDGGGGVVNQAQIQGTPEELATPDVSGGGSTGGDFGYTSGHEATAKEATNAVIRYFDYLERRHVDAALGMWVPEIRPAADPTKVEAAFRQFSAYHATVRDSSPPAVVDGALRAEVPVKITMIFNGERFSRKGTVKLVAQAGEPGHWQIEGADVGSEDPVKLAASIR